MSRIVHFALGVALAVASGLPAVKVARAADYVVGEPGYASPCAEDRYLKRIVNKFDYQVRHVPHLPVVSISAFQDIHERRYEPETEEWPIERRYCGGTVVLSDGHTRDIWYLIEGKMGFAGVGDNVEFCVAGFDRWNVYNGRCRVLH